jgi:hypothetical protein
MGKSQIDTRLITGFAVRPRWPPGESGRRRLSLTKPGISQWKVEFHGARALQPPSGSHRRTDVTKTLGSVPKPPSPTPPQTPN